MPAEPAPSASPPPAIGRLSASVSRYWNRLPRNTQGALFVLLGAFLLTMMAIMFRVLGSRLPPMEVLFFRFLAGLLVLVPLFARRGFSLLRTRRHGMHFTRGVVGTIGNACAIYSIVHMAIADAITIQFSRPLFMLFIAALFLGEVVGRQRAIVAAVGFTGIMMITRPFGAGFEPWAIVAALGALNGTLVVLSVKLLRRTEQTMVIMFYFAVWTTVLTFVPTLIVWQTPTPIEFVMLALTGVLGIFGQSCFTHGIGLGETTFVMPFDYTRIVFGAVFGLVLFGELPGLWSFAGAAVIIGASLYLIRTDTRAGKKKQADANGKEGGSA
jgi:drug/metabolite transporter (DMT)-like permease